MRWGVLVVLASACGRLGFDARQTTGDAAPGRDGARDGALADGAIDAAPVMATLVQGGPVAQSAGGPITTTLPVASAAGTMLVVAVATNDPTSLVLPTGWQTAVLQTSSGTCSSLVGYLPNNPGGVQSVVVTINAGVPIDGVLSEWRGVSTVDVIGQSSSSNPQTAQAVQTATATSTSGTAAVSVFCEDVNTPTYTAGAGWTALGTFSNVSSSPSFIVEETTGLPVGLVTSSATSTVGGKYQAAIAAFR